jgi:hypothetical protein
MKQTMRSARRFSPPWTIDEANDACFVVRDKNGQALSLLYGQNGNLREQCSCGF